MATTGRSCLSVVYVLTMNSCKSSEVPDESNRRAYTSVYPEGLYPSHAMAKPPALASAGMLLSASCHYVDQDIQSIPGGPIAVKSPHGNAGIGTVQIVTLPGDHKCPTWSHGDVWLLSIARDESVDLEILRVPEVA